ncbi:unnamed protein product [Cladocopium goreaui]|uniref:Ubiquitin-like domain-containing protein n=1 Tax=Cladocopium goreaui TaxID=2562237 RepID=A0A9P1DG58_9DINO|nr:unnamed protein product [Cladocopium goreaui]
MALAESMMNMADDMERVKQLATRDVDECNECDTDEELDSREAEANLPAVATAIAESPGSPGSPGLPGSPGDRGSGVMKEAKEGLVRTGLMALEAQSDDELLGLAPRSQPTRRQNKTWQLEEEKIEEDRRAAEEALQAHLEERRQMAEDEAALAEARRAADQAMKVYVKEERRRIAEAEAALSEARRAALQAQLEERRIEEARVERESSEEAFWNPLQAQLEEERKRFAQEAAREQARRATEEARLEEERRRLAEEAAQEEARRIAEEERLEEERKRLAEEEAAREQARRAAEEARLEEERRRLAEEAAQEEARRIAEEERLEEERKRLAEEEAAREQARRAAEEARLEEERRRLAEEEAAQEEARRIAEEERLEEERKRLAEEEAAREQARRAAEEARLEEERRRLAEEAAQEEARRIAEEERLEEERKRLAEEEAAREQARRAAEEAAQEEARRIAEEERLEEERKRLAEEEAGREQAIRAAEEARLEEERRRLAEEAAQEEARRIAEEERLEEERKRLAEEEAGREQAIRAAEEARLEEERRRLAEEAAQEEARRIAEEERLEEERKRLAEEEAGREQAIRAAEEARLEEERRRLAEEAAQEEARRIAEEERLEEERKRLAEEEAAREQARRAAEEARLEEERRRLAEEAAQEEARRIAEEERLEEERRRLAEEEASREQARRAAQEDMGKEFFTSPANTQTAEAAQCVDCDANRVCSACSRALQVFCALATGTREVPAIRTENVWDCGGGATDRADPCGPCVPCPCVSEWPTALAMTSSNWATTRTSLLALAAPPGDRKVEELKSRQQDTIEIPWGQMLERGDRQPSSEKANAMETLESRASSPAKSMLNNTRSPWSDHREAVESPRSLRGQVLERGDWQPSSEKANAMETLESRASSPAKSMPRSIAANFLTFQESEPRVVPESPRLVPSPVNSSVVARRLRQKVYGLRGSASAKGLSAVEAEAEVQGASPEGLVSVHFPMRKRHHGKAVKGRFEKTWQRTQAKLAQRHGKTFEWPDLCISSCIEGLDGAPAFNLAWGASDLTRHHAISRQPDLIVFPPDRDVGLELQCMPLAAHDVTVAADPSRGQNIGLEAFSDLSWQSLCSAGVGQVLYAIGPPTLFASVEKCVTWCKDFLLTLAMRKRRLESTSPAWLRAIRWPCGFVHGNGKRRAGAPLETSWSLFCHPTTKAQELKFLSSFRAFERQLILVGPRTVHSCVLPLKRVVDKNFASGRYCVKSEATESSELKMNSSSSQSFQVDDPQSKTVGALKQQLFADALKAQRFVRFIAGGRILEDTSSLDKCNLGPESHIHVSISGKSQNGAQTMPSAAVAQAQTSQVERDSDLQECVALVQKISELPCDGRLRNGLSLCTAKASALVLKHVSVACSFDVFGDAFGEFLSAEPTKIVR